MVIVLPNIKYVKSVYRLRYYATNATHTTFFFLLFNFFIASRKNYIL